MFEDNEDKAVALLDDELPTWLILPTVLLGLSLLAAIGCGYLVLQERIGQ